MKKQCLGLAIVLLSVFMLGSCQQDPNSTFSAPNGTYSKAAAQTSTAAPAIIYTTGNNIAVMDSDGTHQSSVYTSTASVSSPNWSSSNSATWAERTSTSSAIRALDISVSGGTPVGSNLRTITSLSSSSPTIQKPRWSSLGSTNKIAFALYSGSGSQKNYVCRISASGGTWDTIYEAPNNIIVAGLSWSPDDSKLAVHLIDRSGQWGSFIIINTTSKAVTDSISAFAP